MDLLMMFFFHNIEFNIPLTFLLLLILFWILYFIQITKIFYLFNLPFFDIKTINAIC
jgi:hypothetical protein